MAVQINFTAAEWRSAGKERGFAQVLTVGRLGRLQRAVIS
jgi:hypothetical protein